MLKEDVDSSIKSKAGIAFSKSLVPVVREKDGSTLLRPTLGFNMSSVVVAAQVANMSPPTMSALMVP
uniref:Uncharacterized protein n=1 Tax=Tanacetum cinerariifolium TaxID=118510 RepID=A0A6L2P536_TANCI|nr:hypothetical protein [Tanacetum cinerariifolium]